MVLRGYLPPQASCTAFKGMEVTSAAVPDAHFWLILIAEQ